jgi:putative transposase
MALFSRRHGAPVGDTSTDLKIRLVFSTIGMPRGRGKIERLFASIHQLCVSTLPGYDPPDANTPPPAPVLTLADLDRRLWRFIVDDYHIREHGETRQPPQASWAAGGFLPRLPESLEQLDLLLLTVAKARKVHPDGIHFQGLRYLDPTLAAFVGEPVTIRYDLRDLAEIRVFHREVFLTRAICSELAGQTVGLKEITAARNARRRELTQGIRARASVVDRLIAVHQPDYLAQPPTQPAAPDRQPPASPRPRLKRYRED